VFSVPVFDLFGTTLKVLENGLYFDLNFACRNSFLIFPKSAKLLGIDVLIN
jgi:hypothetical protein